MHLSLSLTLLSLVAATTTTSVTTAIDPKDSHYFSARYDVGSNCTLGRLNSQYMVLYVEKFLPEQMDTKCDLTESACTDPDSSLIDFAIRSKCAPATEFTLPENDTFIVIKGKHSQQCSIQTVWSYEKGFSLAVRADGGCRLASRQSSAKGISYIKWGCLSATEFNVVKCSDDACTKDCVSVEREEMAAEMAGGPKCKGDNAYEQFECLNPPKTSDASFMLPSAGFVLAAVMVVFA